VPEQSVHSRLLEHTHQAALIHAVAVVAVSQDFLHFPPASPAFCFIRWGSYCVTVEAAALFSDQTIIFADACCAKICQNQITTRKKTCQIKAADMISYNQHRKKWQRGCPCNLLINIFDKVSHYLITKIWSETKKICEGRKKKWKKKKNQWTKKICNKETGQKFDISKKSLLAYFFIYPTTIWRGKQWS